jgi:hypothetical protein
MLPDTDERYLSTPLFADISADMSEEELAVSRSTPGNRMTSAGGESLGLPQPQRGLRSMGKMIGDDPTWMVPAISKPWRK